MARKLRGSSSVSSIAALRVRENGSVQIFHQPLLHRRTPPTVEKLIARLVKACPLSEGWILHRVQTNPTGPGEIAAIGSICARRFSGSQLQLAHAPIVFTRATGDQAIQSAEDILRKRFPTSAGWGGDSVIVKEI